MIVRMNGRSSTDFTKTCYLCDVDDNIAEVSPALSPSSVFREFPETLMIEGGLDELREENLRLFMTLCDAGTTVQMQFFPGKHAWLHGEPKGRLEKGTENNTAKS